MSGTIPRGSDYQLALQHPRTRLKDPRLQGARVLADSNGIPLVWSGGFVVTFQVTLANGMKRALRCYTQAVSDMADRYARIRPVVQAAPQIFADSGFQTEGILIDGAWYPVQEMEWIAGQPLNNWISAHCRADALRPLVAEFDALVAALERLGVAHGDLQHGNILVDAGGHLRLIDYDGMFVPGLAGLRSNNQGHRNYQHPARRGEFDPTLDRFSTIVIGLALRALAADPSLWATFGQSGECLLFTQDDFLHPTTSALLHRLERIAACARYLANFRTLCGGRVADVPRLAEFLAATAPLAVRPTTQPVAAWAPAYPVLAAGARNSLLLPYDGQYVELVGQVRSAEAETTRDGKATPFVRLRFAGEGPYDPAHPSTCAVLIFKEGLAAFAAAQRDPLALQGQWVAIHHFLEAFTPPRSSTGARPQMRIVDPNAVVVLADAAGACQRLGASGGHRSASTVPTTSGSPRAMPPPGAPSAASRPAASVISPPAPPVGRAVPPPATGLSPVERRRREDAERARLNRQLWGGVSPSPASGAARTPATPPSATPPGVPPTAAGSAMVPPPIAPGAAGTGMSPFPAGPPSAVTRQRLPWWQALWEELQARVRAAHRELIGGGP